MTEIRPADYLQNYIDSRYEKHAETTAEQKELTARHFTEWCDENDVVLDTDAIYDSLDTIRAFFDSNRLTLSGTRLSHLRDFLDFIASHLASSRDQDKLRDIRDKVKKDRWPDSAFDSTAKEKDPEYLTDEQIESACREADRWTELVIRFLFQTGCRIREMLAVTPDDVNFDCDDVGAAIAITKQRLPDDVLAPPKSANGNRTVELDHTVADMLRNYIERNSIEPDEYIFYCGETKYREDVKDAFTAAEIMLNDGPDADEYKVSEGMSFVSCHWLRHQRNTRLKKQYDAADVQQYMGHEDAEMTDHYTHFDPEEVQGLVGRN